MKKNLFVMAALVAAIPFGALSADWNFQASDFNQEGNVTLNMESGEVRSVTNKSSMYSTSTAPTVVNVQQSTYGAFPLSSKGITKDANIGVRSYRAGTYKLHFEELCVVSRLVAYATRYRGGYTYDARQLTLIVDGSRDENIYGIGDWKTLGYQRWLIAEGKYYIPAGATLELKVEDTCIEGGGEGCNANFSVQCQALKF